MTKCITRFLVVPAASVSPLVASEGLYRAQASRDIHGGSQATSVGALEALAHPMKRGLARKHSCSHKSSMLEVIFFLLPYSNTTVWVVC